MKLQVLQDESGKPTGVFVPMSDWDLIKTSYPDIESVDKDVPQWEQDLIDQRLTMAQNPDAVKPIGGLLDELRRKI
ncbi:MAG: addiction module component CHP02574 family protein [Bacteroidetes bacterium]|nr:addiction module component CHP02574 family protein [Bacteroidota bacterium]